jgi:hypothetical protein
MSAILISLGAYAFVCGGPLLCLVVAMTRFTDLVIKAWSERPCAPDAPSFDYFEFEASRLGADRLRQELEQALTRRFRSS